MPREGDHKEIHQNQQKNLQWIKLDTPSAKNVPGGAIPEIQATICSTKSASEVSSFYHQAAAPNQLPVSTTRQQHQISFQFPPPGSSTKSASSSTTRQQHQISFQFPPPGSSTTSASLQQGIGSQSAVNSTSLPHPHHGSQVCCCLDILWTLFSFYYVLVWAICTGIK